MKAALPWFAAAYIVFVSSFVLTIFTPYSSIGVLLLVVGLPIALAGAAWKACTT